MDCEFCGRYLNQVADKCISEGPMHVAAWYRGTRGPNFIKIGQTPNAAKFHFAPTRSVRDIRCLKSVLSEKCTKVHRNIR